MGCCQRATEFVKRGESGVENGCSHLSLVKKRSPRYERGLEVTYLCENVIHACAKGLSEDSDNNSTCW